MLIVGIVYHIQFMLSLRAELKEIIDAGLIRSENRFPVSYTLIVAVLLLLLGVVAILSMTLNIGPFD